MKLGFEYVKNESMLTQSIRNVTDEIYKKYLSDSEGETASYIPELAKVNPNHFAIAITDVEGNSYSVGDTENTFTLQSISKPIVYGLALAERGVDYVHSKVGVEPTGEAFDSIIELEEKSHRPFNPMINSGAIAIASLIQGRNFAAKLKKIVEKIESFVGHPLQIDEKVYESEKKTAHRNRAIAHLMKHFNVIDSDIDETLDLYFRQCSILVNCKDLASIASTYANLGLQPQLKKQILDPDIVTQTLSLMFTCGMYDTAGEWAFKVGLPAKSGVSGAMFAVVPRQFGIGVYSPRIDKHGHSCRGQKVIHHIARELKVNIFGNAARNLIIKEQSI